MGGGYGNRQKKSSGFFSLFKSKRNNRRVEDAAGFAEVVSSRKVWPSDEDKVRWVADPRIDTKASAFIAHFHASRVSESELHYQNQQQAAT